MVDWDAVDDVFLDMDGTLLDLHYDNYFWLEHLPQRYSEIKDCHADQVREDLHSRYRQMKGTLDWYCLEYWERELQIDVVALKHEVIDKVQFRPGAEDFLEWLQHSGKRIFLVSNAHRSSIDLKFDHLQLHSLFHHICSSHDYQSPKEQQNFWHAFQADIPFEPGRALFIDDNHDVLDSAKEFGIAHLLSIAQPDLNQPVQPAKGYQQIVKFKDVMDA